MTNTEALAATEAVEAPKMSQAPDDFKDEPLVEERLTAETKPSEEDYDMTTEREGNAVDADEALEAIPSPGNAIGTILEAAFVDPAYSWPPAEGQGKNAIELQASSYLLHSVDPNAEDEEEEDPEEMLALEEEVSKLVTESGVEAAPVVEEDVEVAPATRTKVVTTETVTTTSRCGIFHCCKQQEAVVDTSYQREEVPADDRKKKKAAAKAKARVERKTESVRKKLLAERRIQKEKEKRRLRREQEKYSRVPEGILIYRLDTASHTITLLSGPSSNTDMDSLLTEMVVASAGPSQDKSRRGICVEGVDGSRATLVACEQRTAIAWLEAMEMMLSNAGRGGIDGRERLLRNQESRAWAAEDLNDDERDQIEEQYLNLAAYSNNLIRAGAIPGSKSKNKSKKGGQGGAGGIYYSVTKQTEEGDEYDEETLESIAKRRAVIKDSWDFYRMICSLLRDRRKYDEVFKRMQMDPVYPYLNSMTGLNDPGDDGYENADKEVMQKEFPDYSSMTRTEICQDLVRKAETALPSLVEICKALAGSLGMEEVGVGPIKEVSASIRKAEKKYEGDVLKVTDYCRALLVVKDFPTLLALLELARDSFGPLIRRVKLSTLKSDHSGMPGGYRDCKINLELKDHICEIQVHLWPMWVVCGVDGFRHYRHCLEYSTDTFGDPYDALAGLDRKTMAELIVVAEEAVADMPLENLEWYHEKFILDYFAEIGLFLRHGLAVWAETTLRQLIRLRSESPDIGPDHHETIQLNRYLEEALRDQGGKKVKEANQIKKMLAEKEKEKQSEQEREERSLWDNVCKDPFESMMDPNRKEREEEERIRREVKQSKKAWRKIRGQRFKFLDANLEAQGATDNPQEPVDAE